MKLLIHTIHYWPEMTGVGRYTHEMAEWLVARGHDVRVVTAAPFYPEWAVHPGYRASRYRSETASGVHVLRCPTWVPGNVTGVSRILMQLVFAAASLPLLLRQVAWRPDVVMSLEPPLLCAPADLVIAKLSSALSWLNIKDFEVDAAFALGILNPGKGQGVALGIERWILRRYDIVSSISGAMRDLAAKKRGGSQGVVLFPDWVDLDVIRPDPSAGARAREELGVSGTDCVALYSGNIGKKQGIEILIEAARYLARWPSIRILVCGAGVGRTEFEERAQGVPNIIVRDLVPAEKLNGLLNAADIHLLPQLPAASDLVLPSKLLNMLASGKPVVATAVRESEVGKAVVAAGGLLCAPGSASEMGDSILALHSNLARMADSGRQARAYAEEHFGVDAILTAFEETCLAARYARTGGARKARTTSAGE